MNKPLLKQIVALIEAEPKRMCMEGFFSRTLPQREMPRGGVVACIAGWAVILKERKPKESFSQVRCRLFEETDPMGIFEMEDKGASALKITVKQAIRLFYASAWPRRFADAYYNAEVKERAAVVVRRLKYFIRTGQ